MKTLLASLIVAALATPAVAGPDFTTRSPRPHPLAASPASSEIGPLDDVVFATNSTQLTDSGFTQVETAARWMKQHGDYRIVLEGYADSIGLDLYNEDLATRRAFMVRQHLIGHGVAPDRIVMVVFGEHTARGGANQLDRRVVLYATRLAPQQVATASIDRKQALSVAWTQNKVLMTQSRNQRPGTVIGTR